MAGNTVGGYSYGFVGGGPTFTIRFGPAPGTPCPTCSDPELVAVPRELLEKCRRLVHPDTHPYAGPRTVALATAVTADLNAALEKEP